MPIAFADKTGKLHTCKKMRDAQVEWHPIALKLMKHPLYLSSITWLADSRREKEGYMIRDIRVVPGTQPCMGRAEFMRRIYEFEEDIERFILGHEIFNE